MDSSGETLIHVRDAWNGWRGAEIRMGDLSDVHWVQPAGAPCGILHGYVLCTALRGDIPHDCTATGGPHRLLVCVLRRCVAAPVFAELARRANALLNPAV
jgi:hypothetical protein